MNQTVVFLVGAGRSGTTLLYKILSLHPDVSFISNYNNVLPRWVPSSLLSRFVSNYPSLKKWTWFNEQGNAYYVGRSWLKKFIPTPVEGEKIYQRCGVPPFPVAGERLSINAAKCLRRLFESIAIQANAKVVVSKRIANNRRIPMLLDCLPKARFIHLVRDGRDVAYSLSNVLWWDEHIIPWTGLKAKVMVAAGENRLSICAKSWVYALKSITEGLEQVPSVQKLELRYEALIEQPVDEVKNVFSFLDIKMDHNIDKLIDSLGLEPRSPKWSRVWNESEVDLVMSEQKDFLEVLGYLK